MALRIGPFREKGEQKRPDRRRLSMTPDSCTVGRLRCPACGYILHNLPDRHTCPECGFHYDPHAKVYRVYEQGKHIAQIGALAIVGYTGTILYNASQGMMIAIGETDWRPLVFLAAPILLGIRPLYRLLRSFRHPCRVIMNHEGIRFDCPGAKPLDVTWSDFGEAHVNLFTSGLVLRDRGGRSLLRRRQCSIGNRRMRRKLASEVNALAGIYRST
jgi:rubredoxin